MMDINAREAVKAFRRLQDACGILSAGEPERVSSPRSVMATSNEPESTSVEPDDTKSISEELSAEPVVTQDGASMFSRKKSHIRLKEMEDQLQMAESRCGDLKQKLDYMRMLYQGVDRTCTFPPVPITPMLVEKKLKKEKKQKKQLTGFEPYLEGVPASKSGGKKERSHRKRSESTSHTVVSSSKRAPSLPQEVIMEVTHDVNEREEPVRDLIDFTDDTIPEEQYPCVTEEEEVKKVKQDHSPSRIVQSILSGIPHGNNHHSQPEVHTTRSSPSSQAEKPEQTNKPPRPHKHRPGSHVAHRQHIEKEEDENTVTKNAVNPSFRPEKPEQTDKPPRPHKHRPGSHIAHRQYVEMEEDENTVTKEVFTNYLEPSIDTIYGKDFQRIVANETLTRKSTKTNRMPRKDQPYGLVNNVCESEESLRGATKRKKATTRKMEKRHKTAGPFMQMSVQVKAKEDASHDVMLKPKQRKKLVKTRQGSSRSTMRSVRKGADARQIPAYSSEQIPYEAWQASNLVELYHNSAVKTEASVSEEHLKTGFVKDSDTSSMMSYLKKTREEHDLRSQIAPPARPPSVVTRAELEAYQTPRSAKWGSVGDPAENYQYMGSPYTASKSPVKMSHFEQSTVASRLKQVSRSYFQRFNFRNIPFVVGKSTTPSHNLGLNIQQVLSIIKMRQPVRGISAMTLASGLLRESQMPANCRRPVTSLLSQLGSRPGSQRVLTRPPTIVENDEEELPQHDDDGCGEFEVQRGSFPHSRPSTNLEVRLKRESTTNQDGFETYRANWRKKTSFPNKEYSNYQQVLNEYLGGEEMSFLQKSSSRMPNRATSTTTTVRTSSTIPVEATSATWQAQSCTNQSTKGHGEEFNRTLHSRIRGMKEVMQMLNNDFQKLNQQYEELGTTVKRDDKGKLLHEEDVERLREVAQAVQNKEDEIKLVMDLMDEITTLHKMVTVLNKRTSIASMTGRMTPVGTRFSAARQPRIVPREPTTSVRLTRLLRTVQSFQERLKQES